MERLRLDEMRGEKMNPEGIHIVDDAVTNANEIFAYLQTATTWSRSRVGDDPVVDDRRTSESLFFPMLSWTNDPLIHEMNRRVWQEMDIYAQHYKFGFSSIEHVSIQKYDQGAYYHEHVDSSASHPRILSAVLYLNTVPSGGETRFTYFDHAVQPVAGRLLIFPSNFIYRHEALPPKKGIKIAAAYWANP